MKIGDSFEDFEKNGINGYLILKYEKNKNKWLLTKLNTLPTLIYTNVFMQ
jgi:hypothetical protein